MANITVGYDANGSALDYTTIATAFSAASRGDILKIYYSNTTLCKTWGGTSVIMGGATYKDVSLEAMVSGLILSSSSATISFLTPTSSVVRSLYIKGFTIISSVQTLNVSDSNGVMRNVVITFENCKIFGYMSVIGYSSAPTAPDVPVTLLMINCEIYQTSSQIYIDKFALFKAYYCTFFRPAALFMDWNNATISVAKTAEFKNCAFIKTHFYGSDFSINFRGITSTFTNCAVDCSNTERSWDLLIADTDVTITNQVYGTLGGYDLAIESDNVISLQPNSGSDLIGAGDPIIGISTDILGVTRDAATPSIGCYEEAFPSGGASTSAYAFIG